MKCSTRKTYITKDSAYQENSFLLLLSLGDYELLDAQLAIPRPLSINSCDLFAIIADDTVRRLICKLRRRVHIVLCKLACIYISTEYSKESLLKIASDRTIERHDERCQIVVSATSVTKKR